MKKRKDMAFPLVKTPDGYYYTPPLTMAEALRMLVAFVVLTAFMVTVIFIAALGGAQ